MHSRWPWPVAATLFASLVLVPSVAAQAGLGHLGDASIAPRGMLRLHAVTAWTRYDSRFARNGVEPLGALLTADSLGVRQIPQLAAVESLVQTASGVPFSLTLGRSRLDATAREEIIPLALEYGITNWLSVGVMVPVVRKRAAIVLRLDTAGGFNANVGPNLHRTSASAAQTNALVQAEFANAAQQLQQRLNDCQANPGATGCAALLAREAEAQALIASSQTFATELESLYGGQDSGGLPFVPTAQSAAQAAIAARLASFNAQYRDLLSSGVDLLQAIPFGATGPAGVSELQRYFHGEGLRDSIVARERVGIGDIELGIKFRVFQLLPTVDRPFGVQVAVASALALGTGSDEHASDVVDMRLGQSVERIDTRAILDASFGRVGLLAAGRLATALGGETLVDGASSLPAAEANRRVTELQLEPRWHLSGPLAIHAAYSMRSSDRTGGDRLVGGGISYSGLATTARGKTPPIEMRYTHLESIQGDAGRPKFFRDQIELRVYYRLLRR